MSGQKKGPSHPGSKAVDNTAFSSNANVGKVRKGMDEYTPGPDIRKGMDGYTASLILDVAKENMDRGADLYQAMNKVHTPKNDVEIAHIVYEQLGYKVGVIVENPKSHALGIIDRLNTNTGGFYPGDRYPIYIKLGHRTYEYSIFSEHYGDVKDYIHNPKKILRDYSADLQWKIVQDTTLSPEQKQQYIEKQSELAKYDFAQQKEYFEHTKRSDLKKNDKLYVYDYLVYRFKNNWFFISFSEDNIDEYTKIILDHKIIDEELSTWIEKQYIELLKVDSGYGTTDVEKTKEYVLFGVKTPQIVRIYNQLNTLGETYADLKNKVGHILQERIDAVQGDQLYDFVAEVAGTPFEKIAFEKLERGL